MFYIIAQTVTVHLGYFGKKLCPLQLSKIAQSGHTEYMLVMRETKLLMSMLQVHNTSLGGDKN